MAENIVDALIVTLGLDSSEYQQGMEEAEQTTRKFSEQAPREAERGLNQIEAKFGATFKGIFRTFIAPLTAALGTMGIFSSYTQTADRIGKTANRIGASAEDLQAFGEAAKRAGGSMEGFMSSFESLNGQLQRMQAMGGKGRIAPILKQLGISATENGQVKDTFQILRELAGASERLGKQKFAGLARFLGLDQGTIMLLQQGRVSMDEVIGRMRELGVYTKEDFEITQQFNDAMSDLQQVFRSLASVILRVVVPPIKMIAEAMTAVIKTFKDHQGFIVAGLLVIAAVMSGPLTKAAFGLLAALKPLLLPIAAIAGLGAIFDEIATYAEGGETLFEPLWKAIGTPEDFKRAGETVKEFAESVWQIITGLAKDIGGAFADVFAKWAADFDADAFVKSVRESWGEIKTVVSESFDGAFEPLKEAASALKPMFEELGELAISLVKAVTDIFTPNEPGENWSVLRSVADLLATGFKLVGDALKGVFEWVEKITKRFREFIDNGGIAPLADAVEPIKKAFQSVIETVTSLLGLLGDVITALISIFTPAEPGGGWDTLKKIVEVLSLGLQSLAYIVEQVFGWFGGIIKDAQEFIKSFEFLGTVQEAFNGLIEAVAKLFSPEQPGSAWGVLKSIIDGIGDAIDMMISAVKTLFAWVEKILRGLGAWWNGSEKLETDAKNAITGGDERKYVEEQAAEIKKANPGLSDEEARKAATAQLTQDAKLKSDYDVLRGYDADFRNATLQEMGYSLAEIAAFEKRQNKAAALPAAVPQTAAPAPKQGWWERIFGNGDEKAPDAAVAAIASQKPDTAQISQDNRKTVSIKYDTNVTNNNTFNGVENSTAVQNAVSRGSREGTERGLTLAPVNEGVF